MRRLASAAPIGEWLERGGRLPPSPNITPLSNLTGYERGAADEI